MDAERDSKNPVGPDLTALERRLSGWRPSAGALDRDRMLYDACGTAAGADAWPWRLMAASLFLATVGLATFLAHEHSALVRERTLLAQERSQRLRLETMLAARTGAVQPSAPSPPPAAIEPPSPSSYLALSARIADGLDDLLPRGVGIDPARSDRFPPSRETNSTRSRSGRKMSGAYSTYDPGRMS